MFREKSTDATMRSLNFARRKKESDRIERENLKFAKRLLEKNAFIDVRGMRHEYVQHLRYRKLLLRVDPHKKCDSYSFA